MAGLLTHALEQEIGLPVARLLVSVRTAPQLFELAPGRGLEDGLQRLHERFSGSPLGEGPRLQSILLGTHGVDCHGASVTITSRGWGPARTLQWPFEGREPGWDAH
jgi:hypothetical protein